MFLFLMLWFLNIASATETVTIPDVTLQSKKSEQKTSAISTTRFSKEKISNSSVVNLSQFLKQEQSVIHLTKNSGDENQTALSMRGFGDNAAANSLILMDGFPLTNPSLLAPNFNSIPLNDIERIEVFQGSEGSLWGDQAVGGVINIITKRPKRFFTNGIFSVGSYYTFYDTISLGDRNENGLFYKVFALLANSHHYRDHSQQKTNNVAVQLGVDYARGVTFLNLQTYADLVYFPGGLNEAQFHHHPRQATEFKNYVRHRTLQFQLLNIHEFNPEWHSETRLNYHTTQRSGFVFLNFRQNDSLINFNPRLITYIHHNKIIVGYVGQYSSYQLMNSKVHSRSRAQQNHFYLQTTFPIREQVELILGARKAWQANRIETEIGQTVSALDQVFVTEQGLAFHLYPALTFFVRRDGNFSFPKANEETWLSENATSLQVQTGTSYETGATWQGENFKTQVSLYRLLLHHEIAFKPAQTQDQPFGAFCNLDKTLRYGTTFTQQFYFVPGINLFSQFNFVRARFAAGLFSGRTIPAVPAINANAGMDYVLNEHWSTQIKFLYTGSQYAADDVNNVGKKIPPYWLTDVSLQYLFKPFLFILELNNLFDKHYASYVFYNPLDKQNTYYPAAGRNVFLTLKLNIE